MGYLNRSTCTVCRAWIDQPKTMKPKEICACGGKMRVENLPSCMAPGVPTSRLPDEPNYDLVSSKDVNQVIITAEDITLIKRFLGKLKDQTLSRSIHKVLTDLIGRLP